MTKYIVLLICSFIPLTTLAQSPIGAWEAISTSENGAELKSVVIFAAEGYQVLSVYDTTTGKLIHSNGGTWKVEGDTITEIVEFHTDNANRVGTEVVFKVMITDNSFQIVGSDMKFNRIDKGVSGELQGTWLMSVKKSVGETQMRDTNSPRKTMKILSGTRFQWIAYNTETKEFIGTRGGTYTAKNGEFVENIEFFSSDYSKAGLSLSFNYELINENWHHTGLSSKGEPIHEIWSVRE
jgi:hypothetical protein